MSQVYVPRGYGSLITGFELDVPRCAIWAGMGLGKFQPNSEPVLTPSGWIPIGNLTIGDAVTDSKGETTHVTGVFPQGNQPVFRVTFSDGSWTRAGEDHLWRVSTAKERHRGAVGQVLRTKDLVASGLVDKHGNKKWFVPLVEPARFRKKKFAVDPYLLGVILGDGNVRTSGSCALTKDTDFVEQWAGRSEQHPSNGISTRHLNIPGLKKALKDLDLAGKRSWEKHVPREYLLGSPEQRLALLQGLLDTDGSPMARGGIEFCSTSENLIDAVVDIVQSLGGVARNKTSRFPRYQGGIGREAWRINIKLPAQVAPFRLARKLDKYVPATKYPPSRAITAITPDGEEPCTCISVGTADRLYVTRNYILTHNTVCTYTALDGLLMVEDGPVLILAPKRVARSTWPEEARKWAHTSHLRVMPIIGENESERIKAIKTPADVYTINYEQLVWLVDYWGDRWPYRIVVADESTRLKSFRLKQGGVRAGALAKVAHTRVKRFIELTGTPSPNGLIDLWGQMWFLDAGRRLGRTFSAFSNRWFKSHPDGYGSVALPTAQGEITALLQDLCLTIEAKDWFDLKEPIVNNIYVDLPPRVRKLYKDMEREMFIQIEEHEIEAFNAASRTQKLLQLASGAIYLDPEADNDNHPKAREWKTVHDEKLDALEDIIEEANGAPVLVAYHFRSDLARLLKRFKQARRLDDNPETIREWNAGEIPVLLSHPQSAGHGLNLQYGGNILVFFSHNWNLEDRLQIIERIGPVRQMQAGLDRPVFIHNIIARSTADEMVIERVKSKAEVQDLLKAAMKRS